MTDLIPIPFHDTDVLAVEVDGKPHIVLRPFIQSLGLDFATQVRKLRSRSWACVGEMPMQVPGDTQRRTMTTVDVRTALMLLATVNESKVHPDKRPLLIAYQSEVADVIEAYWTTGRATTAHTDPDLLLDPIAQQVRSQLGILALGAGVVDQGWLDAKAREILTDALDQCVRDTPDDPVQGGSPEDSVRVYWQAFEERFVWDLLPLTFLYDLYKAWFTAANPPGAAVGRNTFIARLTRIVDTSTLWHARKVKVHTGSKMSAPEPLIAQYDLERWKHPNTSPADQDPSRTGVPTTARNYRGLERLGPGRRSTRR